MQDEKKEKINELKNFPDEMGHADDEAWEDYTHIRRDLKDSDTMKRIWDIFSTRLFPVLALVFISAVLGISLSHGTHFLSDKTAYILSFIIMIWVSLAPIIWIIARITDGWRRHARTWYIWIAGSQVACGVIFYLMFPDNMSGWLAPLQSFFVASLPMHVVIYFFFIKGGLPASAAWPLTLFGLIFMLYGLVFV